MSVATKPSLPQQGAVRRRWKVPVSRAWWLWLLPCILLYGGIYAWYLYAIKSQPFPGPFNDPLRLFGIIAFGMVLCTAAYSLRRRFVRNLPGKAQDWLWMHIWVGITAVLIALLHENYTHILHDYCQNLSCFTQADAGTSALLALIVARFHPEVKHLPRMPVPRELASCEPLKNVFSNWNIRLSDCALANLNSSNSTVCMLLKMKVHSHPPFLLLQHGNTMTFSVLKIHCLSMLAWRGHYNVKNEPVASCVPGVPST